MTNIRFELTPQGIAILTWDMPDRSTNVLAPASLAELRELVERVLGDAAIRAAIITSAKRDFIVGADLVWLESLMAGSADPTAQRAATLMAEVMGIQQLQRRIETGGKPFAALLNGTALGGGFELALACHYRVAVDHAATQLGLPEAKVGLMPGGGGTQRLVRMLGAAKALPLLLEGRALNPRQALAMGLVDEVAAAASALEAATRWLLAAPADASTKPWDRRGFVVPGPDPRTLMGSQDFAVAHALQRKKSFGNYPALDAIECAVYDGLLVPMDTALKIESRYFVKLLLSPVARCMVRTQFINLQKANKLARRPAGVARRELAKIGVLGAGLMGAGIANICAQAGIDVVLLDVDQAAAERGRTHIMKFHDKSVSAGRMTREEADRIVGRVSATTDYGLLRDAGMVVEAVFEARDVKAEVTRRAEAVLPGDAIFATNTSTLPITGLAENSQRPAQFIGIHFFSPVERMKLVEIIRGKNTSDQTLALAMDFVQRIHRTPIVVNDSRGFFTSRVFATYTNEGLRMIAEGIEPALVENAGRAAGMPMPPLALCDEVSIGLIHQVNVATRRDLGAAYRETPADGIVAAMVERFGRPGKKEGRGFYDYLPEGKKRLWPGLREFVKPAAVQPAVGELRARFLNVQVIESVRCLEEQVLTDPADADIGATLGWGFAPWTGGPLSYVDIVGPARFVQECEGLAQRHGARFEPPALLRRLAEQQRGFYDGPMP